MTTPTTETKTFEMDGKSYETDAETLSVLNGIVKSYRKGGSQDNSAVAAMMALGMATGRIVEIG